MTTPAGTPVTAIQNALANAGIGIQNAQGLTIKKPTRDIRTANLKIGLYGKSGVGKTWAALGIAKHFKTFLIFSERSDTSIRSHPDFDLIEPNLEYVDVYSWEDTKKAFEYVTENQDKYRFVIVDSLTDINKRIIEDLVENSKEEMLSQRQWGQVTSRLERFIRFVRDLRTNVVFICLSTSEKNELTGEICQLPSMTGRLKEEMPAYLDMNGYMYTYDDRDNPGTVARAIQFVATPRAIAKDRNNILTYETADMTAILKKLKMID
jgi:hypothetical protein